MEFLHRDDRLGRPCSGASVGLFRRYAPPASLTTLRHLGVSGRTLNRLDCPGALAMKAEHAVLLSLLDTSTASRVREPDRIGVALVTDPRPDRREYLAKRHDLIELLSFAQIAPRILLCLAYSKPVGWMLPMGSGEIQTSLQAGGIASFLMRWNISTPTILLSR